MMNQEKQREKAHLYRDGRSPRTFLLSFSFRNFNESFLRFFCLFLWVLPPRLSKRFVGFNSTQTLAACPTFGIFTLVYLFFRVFNPCRWWWWWTYPVGALCSAGGRPLGWPSISYFALQANNNNNMTTFFLFFSFSPFISC